MPDLLGFNPNRDLEFDSDRDLGFDPDRDLAFDSGRELGFTPTRDLGFGKRGPVFRGFVCPICGAAVTEDQSSCTECGAVFEPKATASPPRAMSRGLGKPVPPTISAPPPLSGYGPPPPPARAHSPPSKREGPRFCIYCGARLTSEDSFCWQCGNRLPAGEGR